MRWAASLQAGAEHLIFLGAIFFVGVVLVVISVIDYVFVGLDQMRKSSVRVLGGFLFFRVDLY